MRKPFVLYVLTCLSLLHAATPCFACLFERVSVTMLKSIFHVSCKNDVLPSILLLLRTSSVKDKLMLNNVQLVTSQNFNFLLSTGYDGIRLIITSPRGNGRCKWPILISNSSTVLQLIGFAELIESCSLSFTVLPFRDPSQKSLRYGKENTDEHVHGNSKSLLEKQDDKDSISFIDFSCGVYKNFSIVSLQRRDNIDDDEEMPTTRISYTLKVFCGG